MATSIVPGGAYLSADKKTWHDANGNVIAEPTTNKAGKSNAPASDKDKTGKSNAPASDKDKTGKTEG